MTLRHPTADYGSTIKYAKISAASSGNNTIVAAPSDGKKIVVLAYTIIADTSVTAKFQDGAGGTDLTGAMKCGTASDPGGVSVAYAEGGHFACTANTLLNLSLGSAVQVSGHVTYILV